jgi:hypothetical protein
LGWSSFPIAVIDLSVRTDCTLLMRTLDALLDMAQLAGLQTKMTVKVQRAV